MTPFEFALLTIIAVLAISALVIFGLEALCGTTARECNLCGEPFETDKDVWLCPECLAKINAERDQFAQESVNHQQHH